MLVPVYFKPDSVSTKLTPDKINLDLSYYFEDDRLKIGSAIITTKSSDIINPFATLTITLLPVTLIHGFFNYYLKYWIYFVSFWTGALIFCFFFVSVSKIFIKDDIVIKIQKCMMAIATPLIKGTFLSTLICFSFIGIFFVFDKLT